MKKKRLVSFLTFLVILTTAVFIVMVGCAEPAPTAPTAPTPTTPAPTTPAPAETIELKWLLTNQGYDESTWGWNSVMGGGWAKEVERLSGGRVTFNYLVGAVTHEGMYDSLVAGAGDCAQSVGMLNPGRFAAHEIMNIPDLFTVCQRPSKVSYELWKKFPAIQEEYSETKVLALFATTPSPPGIGFATVDKPIKSLEDTKGVKMGNYGASGIAQTNALGFTAVSVPNFEVYEAIQRGIVDGSFMDFDFLTNQNVGELVKYWHPVGILNCHFWFSMNWDSWNSLPPDIQKIMEDVAPKIPDWADYYLRLDKERIAKDWPDLITVEYSDEEKARWRERQDPIQEEFMAEREAKGINAHEIFDEMNRLMNQYAEKLPDDAIPPRGG